MVTGLRGGESGLSAVKRQNRSKTPPPTTKKKQPTRVPEVSSAQVVLRVPQITKENCLGKSEALYYANRIQYPGSQS